MRRKHHLSRKKLTRNEMLKELYPMRSITNIRFMLARKLPRPKLSSCAPWFERMVVANHRAGA